MLTIDAQNALQDDADERAKQKRLRIAAKAIKHPDLCEAIADYLNGATSELDGLLLEIEERYHD